ncbi:terpene synthase [Mycena floridula]|nr:terpene synthase [Mycena floridula]
MHAPPTDYENWRLKLGAGGAHTWHFLKTDKERQEWPQTDIDRYWLGIPLNLPPLKPAGNAMEAAENGFHFLRNLQAPEGHFAGEFGGPMFLLPGVVIGSYVSGAWFLEEERLEMIRYLSNITNDDGGWGLHIEGHSTVLGTALNYCSMRLLGVDRDHPAMIRARGTLHKLGGASASPSWGKFWMSVLNVHDWEGNNPIPPEIWLLPEALPIHPHRWYIHTRAVYLPMSYLYRVRFQTPETPLILSLREELYTEKYDQIYWPSVRNNISAADLYVPHSLFLDAVNAFLSVTLESCPFPPLSRRALDRAYELICMEDENTEYLDLAPVSKMMHMICRFHAEGPDSQAVKQHALTRADAMWLGPDGMRVTGTNGSQLWDTVFAAQAIVETGIIERDGNHEYGRKMLQFIDEAQIRENPKYHHEGYRQATKGAWAFSTKKQGYTLTDCTAEGLKTVLYLQKRCRDMPQLVSDQRMFDSVDLLLSMQSSDGGFSAYEPIRAPRFIEYINPAEVFGNIMVDYTYPECTTSVITGLKIFQQYYPKYKTADIDRVISKAISFLHKAQRSNGGWYGSWGISFTYATMFALESLALAGETYSNSPAVKKACDFLLSWQMEDGGWGESYKSCEQETYVPREKSQVVQTSWAALALIHAKYPERDPIQRAMQLVQSRQLPDGSWAQEAIEGVFSKSCAISYPNFKLTFTFWMLGLADKYLHTLNC